MNTQLISPTPQKLAGTGPEVQATETEAATLTVAIIGLGYVGLPTALSLIDAEIHVVGVEASPSRIEAIKELAVDLQPDDLLRLHDVLAADSITLTLDASEISKADAILICVPTPVDQQLIPDLTALKSACSTVVRYARPGQTIVLTSTSYVGSTRDLMITPLVERGLRPGIDVHVAFSPERVDPGALGHASIGAPRVLGGFTPDCRAAAARVLGHTAAELHEVSSVEAAELTKLHENTFRAVNLAYVNEMADIASELGVDIAEVIDAASTKPYGFMRFTPGPGVGGHCIPCDPHYLLWQLRGERVASPLIEQSMASISRRPLRVVDRAKDLLANDGKSVAGARIHLLGIAYKPGVADLRESPAIEIASKLRALGATVSYTDDRIPSMRLADGSTMHGLTTTELNATDFDLVIVHTRHPDTDEDWLAEMPVILDATYSMGTSDRVHAV